MGQIPGGQQKNTKRDSSAERIPALAKHFLIVDSDMLSQAWAIHLKACSKSTDLHTSVAELQSSILLTMCQHQFHVFELKCLDYTEIKRL